MIGHNTISHKLQASFLNSDKLQKHIRLLFSKGSMYLIVNSNLMYPQIAYMKEADATFPIPTSHQWKHIVH